MTPCQRLKQNLFDLLDADVENHRKEQLEGHIQACPHCSDFYRRLKRQKEFLKGLKPIRTEDHFIILLKDRIRREMAGKRAASRPAAWFSWKWAAGFASIVLVAAAAFMFSNERLLKNRGQAAASVKPAAPPSSSRTASKPDQFVINDFKASPRPASAAPKKAVVTADTVKPDSGAFDELKARLAPVSF
jgi:anti-sigma factor RsiW